MIYILHRISTRSSNSSSTSGSFGMSTSPTPNVLYGSNEEDVGLTFRSPRRDRFSLAWVKRRLKGRLGL